MKREKEFEAIYLSHLSKVKFLAHSYLLDSEQADEVAQDAFISLWENWTNIDLSKGDAVSYLMVTVRNKCFNILKRRLVHHSYTKYTIKQMKDYLNFTSVKDQSASLIFEKEIIEIISDTVSKMPEKVKSTFLLSRDKKMKQKDIAQLQGVGLRTVEYRMQAAILMLRKALKDYLFMIIISMLIWINVNY